MANCLEYASWDFEVRSGRGWHDEIEGAVKEALKMLRVPDHPLERIKLMSPISAFGWDPKMEEIAADIAKDGGKVTILRSYCPFEIFKVELAGA